MIYLANYGSEVSETQLYFFCIRYHILGSYSTKKLHYHCRLFCADTIFGYVWLYFFAVLFLRNTCLEMLKRAQFKAACDVEPRMSFLELRTKKSIQILPPLTD